MSSFFEMIETLVMLEGRSYKGKGKQGSSGTQSLGYIGSFDRDPNYFPIPDPRNLCDII